MTFGHRSSTMANFGRALFSFHRFLNSTSTPPRITPVISPIPTESLLRHIPPLSLSLYTFICSLCVCVWICLCMHSY
ncbi:hypothetical protein RHMOL_Rhmol12G0207800 [Rhododendron molle]|uniref:Uncharacterized protein n=2 Tax=Rhododendron molle TaxID=49168 RepID=A0ACC0LKR3_RHOML|nr:hypothetical protein RHMOL_Rhmol12G0207800 [Rhododendron molle]KAI8529220.1 hypothetical protein RHMOL_Rhmol12G0207800 [Rhododendron molle]